VDRPQLSGPLGGTGTRTRLNGRQPRCPYS
jgi:hypothetical protein